MSTTTLETDYLVIGTGAVGMAFTDSLITDSDARVAMVDRRHAPGGHWHDAYPFVRLHQPSAYYGVNSLSLGEDRIDASGSNSGLLERASAAEICGYYNRVMDHILLPSGQVEHYPMCTYLGEHRFVSALSGEQYQVNTGATIVDANYLQPSIPSKEPPPFEVGPDVRCIPVNDLLAITEAPAGFVVVGGGKTAMDACLWMLERGIAPERIRWIKPRESWLLNREFDQSGQEVGSIIEGTSLQMEASAKAESMSDLFSRLEASKQLMRIDEQVEPAIYRGATVSAQELAMLRRIENVVRLGYVKRIDLDEITLEGGSIPTGPDQLHVHCASRGLNPAPPIPIFEEGKITLQPVRAGLVPFNAALIAHVEATRDDLDEKNRLCPPNPYMDTALDWLKTMVIQSRAELAWSRDPDIAAWLERSRLNVVRGLLTRASEPRIQRALERYLTHVAAGTARLEALISEAEA